MNETVNRAARHWPHLAPLLTPPADDAACARLIAELDQLLDAGAADEAHPLAGLASLVGDLIEAYEERHHPMPQVWGTDLLRALMQEHGIRQTELPEIGAQPVVSELLAGKRTINARQALALAQRFHVDVGVFLVSAEAAAVRSLPASGSRAGGVAIQKKDDSVVRKAGYVPAVAREWSAGHAPAKAAAKSVGKSPTKAAAKPAAKKARAASRPKRA